MKRNNICRALVAVITVSLLLTGCKGNAAKTTNPSDALLATETTAATEATKATTPKHTKPSTTKTTKPTGKTDNAKATEATKPAASEPAATQKPAESQKPAETPKATEAPKPTNPPATNPPATEAPKPTNPPETEPPETEPEDPYPYDIYEAMEYGNSYAAAQGFTIDYSVSKDESGYIMTNTVATRTLKQNGGQQDLNMFVVDQILSTMSTLTGAYGDSTAEDWAYYHVRCLIEETTLFGDPAYEIYFLYT